jgi:hypothetical protein
MMEASIIADFHDVRHMTTNGLQIPLRLWVRISLEIPTSVKRGLGRHLGT